MIRKYWKSFTFFWGLFALAVGGACLFFYLIAIGKLGFMPTFEELENPTSRFSSEVYSADGKMLGKYFRGNENRRYTDYKDIPANVLDALVATEDVRFYNHSGIDARGLARVAGGLLSGSTSSGGGSTLSQQLAKMLFPRNPDQGTMGLVLQKFREWVIAVKLERSYTKEEIITMYLNKFDFLNLAVGINSAAHIYFGIPTDSLRVEQSAMLVGMAKNPSLYNPLRAPERVLGRRNVVLRQMKKYGMITAEAYDSLARKPLGINFQREDHKEGPATYFREYLRLYMTAAEPVKDAAAYRWNKGQYRVDSLAWEDDPLYGWCNKNRKADGATYDLYSDGLKIYSTLDSRMQRYAEEAVMEHLGKTLQPDFDKESAGKKYPPFPDDVRRTRADSVLNRAILSSDRFRSMQRAGVGTDSILRSFDVPSRMSVFSFTGVRDTVMTPRDSLKYYKSILRAALLVMNPRNGHVKAYVGGADFHYFMYDMVSTGRRQVGSTIKPILYTLAMQEGLDPCQRVLNVPQTFILPDGEPWTPRNSSVDREGEMVTLKWGLANSINNISAWVLKQFTPYAVSQMAAKMGITSTVPAVPSIFLGSAEITVKEMVAAFAVFANKGVYNAPVMVTRVEDKYGNVLASFQPNPREVITESTAYLMTSLLEEVVNKGTGMRLRYRYGLKDPMGGKTGTTQEHSDGWFIGITPALAGGVWAGAEDRDVHFQELRMGQGAQMALPIWAIFMQKVRDDASIRLSPLEFEPPSSFRRSIDCGDDIPEEPGEEKTEKEIPEELFF
ncbi:MAG: transglycosylase domain-containing protein [Odoribacteraceae bacterium]|jgi:penicillin-binding protein 1A|nr:transglycosylase domain-containing protein [Odoribacteraceae bacterium]